MLKQAGISKVVFEEPTGAFKSRWNLDETLNYLKELEIEAIGYRRSE
jgi:hypothetical protein